MSDNADGDADPYHSQTENSIEKEYFKTVEISDRDTLPSYIKKAWLRFMNAIVSFCSS